MSFGSYVANGFRILFFDPKAVKENRNDKESFKHGLILLAIVAAIVAGVVALAVAAVGAAWGSSGQFGSFAWLVAFIAAFAVIFFLGLISYGIIHLLATAFGGKANIKQYFAVALSLSFAGTVIGIPVEILSRIPYIGQVISLAWSIYLIVVSIFAVRETYKLTSGKAVAVVLIPALVVFVIAMIVAFTVIASYAGFTI